jgi:hypothetical protein
MGSSTRRSYCSFGCAATPLGFENEEKFLAWYSPAEGVQRSGSRANIKKGFLLQSTLVIPEEEIIISTLNKQ